MILTVNIPAIGSAAPAATLTIDLDNTSHKIHAIKEVRALAGVGLKEAKDAMDDFLAFPSVDAERHLVEFINLNRAPTNQFPPVDVAHIQSRLNSALDRVDSVEANNRRLNAENAEQRAEIERLSAATEEEVDKAIQQTQDTAIVVLYHGLMDERRHGFYTAFYQDNGNYRLIHPQDYLASIKNVSRDSFTIIQGCDPHA